MKSESKAMNALNRLAKWRTLFSGWQLGTRPLGDPESDALRDHREATLVLRAEVSALVRVLLNKGVITEAEFNEALAECADEHSALLSQRFLGIRATDEGLEFDPRAAETMKGWKP